jgi:Tol biopolymer transport system component
VDKKLALVASCGTAPNKPDVQATMVNFAGSSPVLTDVKTAAGTTINFAPFQIKSGGTQVALGTQEVLTTPKAGGARSAGLFLYDLSTASLTPAAPAEGAEQYAIGWSPDGRYLLAASVQAQGVCGFSIIDTTSKAVTKVDPGITVCGLSGGMIGWTKLGI